GLGRRHEEMVAAVPMLGLVAGDSEPGLVHERRGLERVAGGFLGHLERGQVAQLLINQWQKLLRGAAIALLNAIETLGSIAHTSLFTVMAFYPSFLWRRPRHCCRSTCREVR